MREQLIQYVELLFAGARDCEDIKQEILQNTLDRYDDLIAEGKVPEAAYRLAITGIGDISDRCAFSFALHPNNHLCFRDMITDEGRKCQLASVTKSKIEMCKCTIFTKRRRWARCVKQNNTDRK